MASVKKDFPQKCWRPGTLYFWEYKLQNTMLQEQVILPWSNVMNLIAHPEMRPQWNEVMLCLCERIFVLETKLLYVYNQS